jgi:glycosyltransferase involved in cell wall biosynthesis
MNVAQVLCAGTFAGAEAVACSLTKALEPLVDRSLLYLVQETRSGAESCAALVEKARAFDIEVRLFATDRRFSTTLLAELRTALRQDAIDVAHSHSYKSAFYCPLIRLRGRNGRPALTCFTIHGFDQSSLRGRLHSQSVSALGAYSSDRLVGVSQKLTDFYRRWPGLGHKIETIPNAIIDGAREPLAQLRAGRESARTELAWQLDLDVDVPWVALIGRLTAVKNHRLFVDLAARTAEVDARFLVVGDGPLRAELQQLIAERGLQQRVILTGHLGDVAALYRGLDLVALTSDTEGSPMVLLEAMSYGLPVLSTSVGGVPDMVKEGENGLLFGAGDAVAGTAQLERLLTDPALRQRLGEAGHRAANGRFSAETWARRHLDLYRTALSR